MIEKILRPVSSLWDRISTAFTKRSPASEKIQLHKEAFTTFGAVAFGIFIVVVSVLPEEPNIEFYEKAGLPAQRESDAQGGGRVPGIDQPEKSLWSSPAYSRTMAAHTNAEADRNTAMILDGKLGNANNQLRAGLRLPLRIADKFIVSQESVPILAELTESTTTPTGLRLPAGTKFYGEANFQRGSDRATVKYRQISLPSGQIRTIGGIAVGKDGQPGIPGKIYSDGTRNTAGQILTSFVSGLASGSVETDVFGRSQGGLSNGLLSAVATTAKDRAQVYGEKMKAEREWIEVESGTECDALLTDSLNLQPGLER